MLTPVGAVPSLAVNCCEPDAYKLETFRRKNCSTKTNFKQEKGNVG